MNIKKSEATQKNVKVFVPRREIQFNRFRDATITKFMTHNIIKNRKKKNVRLSSPTRLKLMCKWRERTKLEIQRIEFISKWTIKFMSCNNIPHLNCIDIYDMLLDYNFIFTISFFLHFTSHKNKTKNNYNKTY